MTYLCSEQFAQHLRNARHQKAICPEPFICAPLAIAVVGCGSCRVQSFATRRRSANTGAKCHSVANCCTNSSVYAGAKRHANAECHANTHACSFTKPNI